MREAATAVHLSSYHKEINLFRTKNIHYMFFVNWDLLSNVFPMTCCVSCRGLNSELFPVTQPLGILWFIGK